ncbi:tail fiber assembly protein [Rosenbergiella australiborealis]|uniref:tail fiber assembly protein n=1 Tax=Rosenbergiella australiborealis TaxID=1544696 RepID=UPI001F4E92C5|nr:tail fiber assembly protein [Rosenbergiella australiborealis]
MYFSIKNKGFYPEELLDSYEESNSKPSDLQFITDEEYSKFFNPPIGYHSIFDDHGPRIEKNDEQDYVGIAENKKRSILDGIPSRIAVYQTKLLMGIKLSDDETKNINLWIDYSDKVNSIDTSKAPIITWPTSPDDDSIPSTTNTP